MEYDKKQLQASGTSSVYMKRVRQHDKTDFKVCSIEKSFPYADVTKVHLKHSNLPHANYNRAAHSQCNESTMTIIEVSSL